MDKCKTIPGKLKWSWREIFERLVFNLSTYIHRFGFIQLRREGRVNDVNDVVAKGQNVKVKVLSMVGKKISLSMKVMFDWFFVPKKRIIVYIYL